MTPWVWLGRGWRARGASVLRQRTIPMLDNVEVESPCGVRGGRVETPDPEPLRAANEKSRGKAAPGFIKHDFALIISRHFLDVTTWRKPRKAHLFYDGGALERSESIF